MSARLFLVENKDVIPPNLRQRPEKRPVDLVRLRAPRPDRGRARAPVRHLREEAGGRGRARRTELRTPTDTLIPPGRRAICEIQKTQRAGRTLMKLLTRANFDVDGTSA